MGFVGAVKMRVNVELEVVPPQGEALVGSIGNIEIPTFDWIRSSLGLVLLLLLIWKSEKLPGRSKSRTHQLLRYPVIHENEETPFSARCGEIVDGFGPLIGVGRGERREINDRERIGSS